MRRFLLQLILLCAVAQGAWADTWDGTTYNKPEYKILDTRRGSVSAIVISKASELAWLQKIFSESAETFETALQEFKIGYLNIVLTSDIDMGDEVSWTPLKCTDYVNMNYGPFRGKFYGEGHTIRINIKGATDNYQGLFYAIGENSEVYDLHLTGSIQCNSSRIVGGIVGENSGTVKECCMSGNVTNNDKGVGGIVGTSRDGLVGYNVFYGQRFSTHEQDYVTIGDLRGEGEIGNQWYPNDLNGDQHDEWVNDPERPLVLREALPYPYSVTIADDSKEAITTNLARTRPGKTVTLTRHPAPPPSTSW